jgi:hypothetical protein
VTAAIGFARLLEHYNLTGDADYTRAIAIVKNGLSAGQNFSAFLDASYSSFIMTTGHDWAFTVFHYARQQNAVGILFAPEIGRFLREYALSDVQRRVSLNPNEGQAGQKNAIESSWPQWFLTRGEFPRISLWTSYLYGENHMVTPDTPWALFMIHAHVYEERGDALKRYLDVPYNIGDMCHLQRLVATIQSYGGRTWSGNSGPTLPIYLHSDWNDRFTTGCELHYRRHGNQRIGFQQHIPERDHPHRSRFSGRDHYTYR